MGDPYNAQHGFACYSKPLKLLGNIFDNRNARTLNMSFVKAWMKY